MTNKCLKLIYFSDGSLLIPFPSLIYKVKNDQSYPIVPHHPINLSLDPKSNCSPIQLTHQTKGTDIV